MINRYSSQWRAKNARYTDAELQKMSAFDLLELIRSKKVSYKDVDKALEKISAYRTLDWLGDKLAEDDLKGK